MINYRPTLSLRNVSIATFIALIMSFVSDATMVQGQDLNLTQKILLAQSNRTRRIQFKRGTTSSVINDAVVRGTRDIYLVGAKASQKMNISLSSLENNAVFDLIAPDGTIISQEVTSVGLFLPLDGEYKLIVGGTRGNATYQLFVEIQ